MNTPITETQVIALSVNEFIKTGCKRPLSNIVVEKARRLSGRRGSGWTVFFVFDELDEFLHKTMTFEVTESGDVNIRQTL